MSKILVTGSLAYDYIMRFSDVFSNHILPEQLEILNVSFTAGEMSKNFGGTAGNIAYSISLLKETPIIFGSVGKDFSEYNDWLIKHNIDVSEIQVHEEELTASAHIITDKKNNQITAFHGGAMLKNDISILPLLDKHEISVAIVSPDGKDGMLRFAKELQEREISYIYDPGHSIPSFDKNELHAMCDGAFMIIVNEYERHLFLEKAQMTCEQLLDKVKYLIVTKGGKGSTVITKDGETDIQVAKADEVKDPTGAGDAYRGGLLKGLLHKTPIDVAVKFASVASSYAVENAGTQSYNYNIVEFKERFVKNYGENADLTRIFPA